MVKLFLPDRSFRLQNLVIYPTELAVTPRFLQNTILVKIYLLSVYDLMLLNKRCR